MLRPSRITLIALFLITNMAFGDDAGKRPKAMWEADRAYAEAIKVAETAYNLAVSGAHAAYLAALKKALTEETKAGHLDEALEIRDLRDAAKESGPPLIQKVLAKPAEQPALVPGDADNADAAKMNWARLHKACAQIKTITLEPRILVEEVDNEKGWQRVPDAFKRHRAAIYMGTGKDNGVADFEVTKDGTIFLACNYSYQGNSSGDWDETRWTKEQFIQDGWTEVSQDQLGGLLVRVNGREQVIFMKQVKRGEKYRLRCNKYEPPYVIVFF